MTIEEWKAKCHRYTVMVNGKHRGEVLALNVPLAGGEARRSFKLNGTDKIELTDHGLLYGESIWPTG